jgi:hypothetical protein
MISKPQTARAMPFCFYLAIEEGAKFRRDDNSEE